MVLLAIRRLLGIAVALALVSGVTGHLGPQLATRSMTRYVDGLQAAERGDTSTASSIGTDLRREWLTLASDVTDALARARAEVDRMLP